MVAAFEQVMVWIHSRVGSGTPSAAVYAPCPRFLLAIVAAFLIAEVGAVIFGLPAPHRAVPLDVAIPNGLSVGCIYAAASLPKTRWQWVCCLSAGLILPLGNMIIPAALFETSIFLPRIYDEHVVMLDAAFGTQISIVLGNFLAAHGTIRIICGVVYALVLFPAAWVALVEGRIGRRTGIGAIPTFLAIAGVGFTIYHILPVIGPGAYFGAAFPLHPAGAPTYLPRNAMPSLHTAWVLMAWLCARGMRKTRAVIGIALAIMLLATMGSGEHYLTDLICAAPFVLLMRGLCASELRWSDPARRDAMLGGASMLVLWGLAVRGIIQPADVLGLVPTLAVATLIASFFGERKLARAQGLSPAATR